MSLFINNNIVLGLFFQNYNYFKVICLNQLRFRFSNLLSILLFFSLQESWDYIGSSRMVYDMEHNDFPSDDQTWKVDILMSLNEIQSNSITNTNKFLQDYCFEKIVSQLL